MRRRDFFTRLGVAGAALVAAPVLRARTAHAGRAPRRIVIVFTPNGTVPEAWRPVGEGAEFGFAPGSILEPLAPYRSRLLVLRGVHMSSAQSGPGSAHQKGAGHFLTGRALLKGSFSGGGGQTCGFASGISVDQEIANAVGGATRFRSLEFGVEVMSSNVRGRISYRGANQPLAPMDDPFAAFVRIFSGVEAVASPAEAARLLAERRSVLDFLRREVAAVYAQAAADERPLLELHLESLRDVERRLAPIGGAAACRPPALGSRTGSDGEHRYPEIGRLQMDILAMALACDLTRVATLMWSNSTSQQNFPWLGIEERHHDISHAGDSNTVARDQLTKIDRWYTEQLAYLLGKLDALAEPTAAGRTVLDHTVVVGGNELGKGNNHTHKDIPWVLAGSCGGALATGRFLEYEDQPHNNLLLALCHAMGLRSHATFGDPAHCTGVLPGLLA